MIGLDRLDDELRTADGVVVSLPGTPETERLLDAARLALLPAHAVVVNVGRGTVIDGKALNAALETGSLRGAVLDVTDPEPLPVDHPLLTLPNCLVVPHIASASIKTRDAMSELAADNIINVLNGRAPKTPVNREVVEQKGLK